MKTLKELREEIKAKSDSLAAIFAEAGPDYDMAKVTSIPGDSAAKAAAIKSLNDELSGLGKELDEVTEIVNADAAVKKVQSWLNEPVDRPPHPTGGPPGDDPDRAPVKSLGEMFVESEAYKAFDGHEGPTVDLADVDLKRLIGAKSMKTLFATTAGWSPESVRGPRVELTPERELVVADLPSPSETGQAAVKYMEETTKTPAAAETAEAGTYPEAAFALTERSVTVRKIAVFIPITDEQFEDEPRARDYIDSRLVRAVNERLDGQLVSGNGTPPNITGYLNVAGIQTQAKAADPTFDAIHKGITKVRAVGFAEPDAVLIHPNDWQEIRLTRTADGIYILGNPADPGPDRIWGKQVIQTVAETEGTALVGAFRSYSELAMRRGLELKVSDSHSDFFVNGKLAVRADMRAALVVYRPLAFCTITGI